MRLNRTSVWKVMTIWISRDLPLFNFELLDIWCAWIGHPSEKLWPFEFLASFRFSSLSVSICEVAESGIRVKCYGHLNFLRSSGVQFRASRYIMIPNRTSVWKVMTIRISPEFPLFNFKRLDMSCAWTGHPSEMLWPFEFLESFRCSIPSVSLCFALESDIRAKSYDHLNFSRASHVKFWASRCIMRLNRTSVIKVMTIWISRDVPLFDFELLDMWCAWIGHPSEKLWPFEYL